MQNDHKLQGQQGYNRPYLQNRPKSGPTTGKRVVCSLTISKLKKSSPLGSHHSIIPMQIPLTIASARSLNIHLLLQDTPATGYQSIGH